MTNEDFEQLWALADNLRAAAAKLDNMGLGRRTVAAVRLLEICELIEATEAKLRDWLNDHDPEGGA